MTNKTPDNKKIETELITSFFLPEGDLSVLISAALVDRDLCELLLTNPGETVEFSYGTEFFKLNLTEIELLLSVKNPASLADLVQQVTKKYAAILHKDQPK